MKNYEILKSTDNSSAYRKAFIKLYSSCPMCSPNKECNAQRKYNNDCNNWKSNRRFQWK